MTSGQQLRSTNCQTFGWSDLQALFSGKMHQSVASKVNSNLICHPSFEDRQNLVLSFAITHTEDEEMRHVRI